jgi:hypothetical protein
MPRSKFRTWLKILVPAALLLGVVAAVIVKVLVEELPAYAQTAAIQARFGEQLECLQELMLRQPGPACLDHDSPLQVMAGIERLEPWWDRFEERADLFAEPVILAAGVVIFCDGAEHSFNIKNYDEPTGLWSRSVLFPGEEWPSVSLWYGQSHRVVRYEDRLTDEDGTRKGIRLALDLELLADD